MPDVLTFSRLDDIPAQDWDSLVGDDGFYLSYDWLKYVESEPHELSRYLLATQAGALRGALVLSRVHDAATLRYRGEHFADLLGVDGETLVAGGTRGYHSVFLLAPSADERRGTRRETLCALLTEALAAAGEQGCSGVVFPFITTGALAELAEAATVRAAFELPEAEITGCAQGLDAYCERQAKRVREKIRVDQRKFARAGWVLRERNLTDCWRDAARLLYSLQLRHGHAEQSAAAMEHLMAGQVRLLAGRSLVFTCEDDRGIAGFGLWYRWRTTLYGRVAGFDYDRLRDGREYFSTVIYAPLQHAADAGVNRLHLGVGSWEAKGYRGAVLHPMWSAFIPVGSRIGAGGLDLADPASVREWAARIGQRGIRIDAPEWEVPERPAGVSG